MEKKFKKIMAEKFLIREPRILINPTAQDI